MADVKDYTEEKLDINEIAKKIKQEYAAQNSAQTATATATAEAPAPAASEEDLDNAIDVDIDNIEFEVESGGQAEDEDEYYVQPEAETYEEADPYTDPYENPYGDYNYGRHRRAYRAINKHAYTWLFSFVLGMYGGDRFIRGQVGLGILKLMTFGGFGFWYLADLAMAMYKSYGGPFSDSEEVTFDRFGNFTD